jgi:hypothetical protein
MRRAKRFYDSALRREEALVENTVTKVEEEGISLAAVIVGGFHADRLAQAFKDQGYSLLTVSPRFAPTDSEAGRERYFEILKYNWGSGPSAVPNPSRGGK